MQSFDKHFISALNAVLLECEISGEYDAGQKTFTLKIAEPEPKEIRNISLHKWLWFYRCNLSMPFYITGEIKFYQILDCQCRNDYEYPELQGLAERYGRQLEEISYDEIQKKIIIHACSISRGDMLDYEFTLSEPQVSYTKERIYYKDYPVDLGPATLYFFIRRPDLKILQDKLAERKKNIAEATLQCLSNPAAKIPRPLWKRIVAKQEYPGHKSSS